MDVATHNRFSESFQFKRIKKHVEPMTDEVFEPYRKLAINVIFLALRDGDRDFFLDEWSAFWCRVAGFDPDQARLAALEHIKQRKPWGHHLVPAPWLYLDIDKKES